MNNELEETTARKHPLACCERCTLRGPENGFVPTEFASDGHVIAIGEAPGYEEVRDKRPFVGQSGKMLRSSIKRAGEDPTKVTYMNVCSCRPPGNRTPTPDEVEACSDRFNADLAKAKGDTVLLLGKTACDALNVGGGESMTKMRGQWVDVNGKKGMTTWHPAYVLRKPSELESFVADITRAFAPLAGEGRPDPNIVVLDTVEELESWINAMTQIKPELLCFDLETQQLQYYERPDKPSDKILMMAVAWSTKEVAIITHTLLYNPESHFWLNFMFDTFTMVGHNAKFDVVYLRVQLGVKARTHHDTMLMHYALNEMPPHGLKSLAKTYMGVDDYEGDLVQKYLRSRNDDYGKVPFYEMSLYAAIDVCCTLQLYHIFKNQLVAKKLWDWPYKNLLMEISLALTEMEYRGTFIDAPYLREWEAELEIALEAVKKEINEAAGHELNPASPMQLKKFLFEEAGLPMPKHIRDRNGKSIGEGKTNKQTLEWLKGKHPVVDLIFKYRRLLKIKSSYVTNLLRFVDVNGRVHPNYLVHGTETGRISVRDPALQTIPRESTDSLGARIRAAFTAPPGRMLAIADYSQAELRVLAALSMEPFLLNVYAQGRDLHTEAAVVLFGPNYTKEQRNWTKMMNFAYAYGGTEHSFAAGAGMPLEQARAIVRKYDANMQVAKQWKLDMMALARKQGYVESPLGRRRRFPVITNDDLEEVRKGSINAPVQGTASDLTLLAAARLIKEGYDVVLAVHDSLIVECDEATAEETSLYIKQVMEEVGQQYLPQVVWKADAELARRWGKKEVAQVKAVAAALESTTADLEIDLSLGESMETNVN